MATIKIAITTVRLVKIAISCGVSLLDCVEDHRHMELERNLHFQLAIELNFLLWPNLVGRRQGFLDQVLDIQIGPYSLTRGEKAHGRIRNSPWSPGCSCWAFLQLLCSEEGAVPLPFLLLHYFFILLIVIDSAAFYQNQCSMSFVIVPCLLSMSFIILLFLLSCYEASKL